MEPKIEFLDKSQIIKVTFDSKVTLDERVNVVHKICVEYAAIKSGLKILIDATSVKQIMSEVEQTLFANYIASRTELKTALVAVIVKPEQVINQTVLEQASRLGHKIQLFAEEGDAITWLNYKEAD